MLLVEPIFERQRERELHSHLAANRADLCLPPSVPPFVAPPSARFSSHSMPKMFATSCWLIVLCFMPHPCWQLPAVSCCTLSARIVGNIKYGHYVYCFRRTPTHTQIDRWKWHAACCKLCCNYRLSFSVVWRRRQFAIEIDFLANVFELL